MSDDLVKALAGLVANFEINSGKVWNATDKLTMENSLADLTAGFEINIGKVWNSFRAS